MKYLLARESFLGRLVWHRRPAGVCFCGTGVPPVDMPLARESLLGRTVWSRRPV